MEENLKKTCLYDSHVALGAKMSPFAGFIMPIQYTNITDEFFVSLVEKFLSSFKQQVALFVSSSGIYED